MRIIRRLVATTLAVTLISAPVTVSASGAPDPATEAAIEEASKLYEEGVARFEMFDYVGAIDLWTRAYARLPATDDVGEIKSVIVHNTAIARRKAFEIDGEVSHLRQAQKLLEKYVQDLQERKAPEAELRKSQEILAEVEKSIEEAAAGKTRPEEPAAADDEPDEPPAKDTRPPASGEPPRDDGPEPRPSKGLIIGGSVSLGLGVGALGASVAGMLRGKQLREDFKAADADRESIDTSGVAMDGLAIGAGVAGGVLTVTGVVLLAIGLSRKAGSKNTSFTSSRRRLAWHPTLGGLQLGF